MTGKLDLRRMTLRDLLTSAEKGSRDLADHLQTTLLSQASDCRDLSRPIRKRSHYPTVLALVNSLNKLQRADAELEVLMEHLLELLETIRDQARRERFRR